MKFAVTLSAATGSYSTSRLLVLSLLSFLLAWQPFAFAAATDEFGLHGYGGELVEVGGREVYLRCVGSGDGPLVVMDSGMGGFSVEWFKVQDMLPGLRSCSYDRAGYGHSSPTTEPRISSLLAEELYELLQAAHQPGPYILVGHSFGGYNVRYFAGAWPQSVVGMVLVDSSHPEQFERMPSLPDNSQRRRRNLGKQSGVRLRPVVVTGYKGSGLIDHYPEKLRSAVNMLMLSRKSIYTERREFIGFKHSASELDWVVFPENLPLAVVHRGRRVWPETPIGDAREEAWRSMQEELASLSQDSIVLEARNSGHMVHMEQPELVAQAIRWVFRRACISGRASSCSSSQVW